MRPQPVRATGHRRACLSEALDAHRAPSDQHAYIHLARLLGVALGDSDQGRPAR